MQTFLPYQDFSQSAKCLDTKRLGKQRVETLQILNTITGKSIAWRNHPAVLMWKNNPIELCLYGMAICDEWIKRGYKDTTKPKIQSILDSLQLKFKPQTIFWLNEDFIRSHRSNLLRKNKEWYSQFTWNMPDNLPYHWPIKINNHNT